MVRDDVPLPIVCLDSDADELEHHIRECGDNMLQAYAEGNREAAEQWLELQRVAIGKRTTATVGQLEAERGLGATR